MGEKTVFQAASPGDASRGRDGDQTPARRQREKRRPDVTQIGVVPVAGNARRRGERRVHENDVRPDPREVIGDGLGVVTGDARVREETGEEAGPGVRDLVQEERALAP